MMVSTKQTERNEPNIVNIVNSQWFHQSSRFWKSCVAQVYKWGHTYGARNFGLGPKSSNPCGSQNDVQEAMCQRIFESMPVLSIGILIAKCWFVWCATLYPLGNEGFILPTYIGCNWSSGLNWVRKQLNLILSSFIPHPVLHWLVILSPWVDFRCANGAQDSPVVEASWCWDSIYIYIYMQGCDI